MADFREDMRGKYKGMQKSKVRMQKVNAPIPLLHSNFFILTLHALALAADQHSGHRVGRLASFGQRRVGTVPAGVVHIVAGGAALAVAALATGSAVQDDLARAGGPVFVDEEFW